MSFDPKFTIVRLYFVKFLMGIKRALTELLSRAEGDLIKQKSVLPENLL
jgi:hypothetical protein